MITNNTVPAMPAAAAPVSQPVPQAVAPQAPAPVAAPNPYMYAAPAAPVQNAYAYSNPAPVQGYGNPYQNQNQFTTISEDKFKEDFMSQLPEGVTAEQALHSFINTVGEQTGSSADVLATVYKEALPSAPTPVTAPVPPVDPKAIEKNIMQKVAAQNAAQQRMAKNQTFYSQMQDNMRQQGWTQQMISDFDKASLQLVKQRAATYGGSSDLSKVDLSQVNFDGVLNQVHAKYTSPAPTGAWPVAPQMATASAPVQQSEAQAIVNHMEGYFNS